MKKLHLLRRKNSMYCGSSLDQNPDIKYVQHTNTFLSSKQRCNECLKMYKQNIPVPVKESRIGSWDGRKSERNDKKSPLTDR